VGDINRRTVVQAIPGKNVRLYPKIKANRSGGMDQLADHLPYMCKPLSSKPSSTKKENFI
jgi:hypothetical protein